ncbi:MAG: ferrous iron transport protein A [Lachnospiraceae bacterium]|nr:ferrous iron transport protein A [Lachnospiraceae bacterium]
MDNKTLWSIEPGKEVSVERILLEDDLSRRLEALGLNEGTILQVITKKKSGAMVIKVRGSRLALGKQITSNIEVKEIVCG